MFFLLAHIILISGFGLFLKDARNRGHRLNPIGFINYLTAFLISVGFVALKGSLAFTEWTFAFGFANGVTYATGFALVTLGIRLSGVVVTIAIVRLSVVVPILFAILLWNEMPNAWQIIGIVLACCALPLLSTKTRLEISPLSPILQSAEGRKPTTRRRSDDGESGSNLPPFFRVGKGTGELGILVIAILLINSGISRLAMKAFNEMCPSEQKPMYLLFLFGITAIAYAGVCAYQKAVPTRWENTYGVVIGLCNVGGSWAFLNALDRVDALIAFPVSGSGGVLFTMLVGISLLGERLNRKSMVGVIASIFALIFVNLKSE